MKRLTDEQRTRHQHTADCGMRAVLHAIGQDCEAIAESLERYDYSADSLESAMEALMLASDLIHPTRELLDLEVTSYAMASIDRLHEDEPDDIYTEE